MKNSRRNRANAIAKAERDSEYAKKRRNAEAERKAQYAALAALDNETREEA